MNCWSRFTSGAWLGWFLFVVMLLGLVSEFVFNMMSMVMPFGGKVVYTQFLAIGLTIRYQSQSSLTTLYSIVFALIINLGISLSDPTLYWNILSSFVLFFHCYIYYIIILRNYKREEMELIRSKKFVDSIPISFMRWWIHIIFIALFDLFTQKLLHTGLLISFAVGIFYHESNESDNLRIKIVDGILIALYLILIYDIATSEDHVETQIIVSLGIAASILLFGLNVGQVYPKTLKAKTK